MNGWECHCSYWECHREATGLMVEYWGKWAHHQLHIRTVPADRRPQHLTQSLGRLSTSWITARTKSTTRDSLGIKFESNQKVKQTNKSQSSWSSGCVVTPAGVAPPVQVSQILTFTHSYHTNTSFTLKVTKYIYSAQRFLCLQHVDKINQHV